MRLPRSGTCENDWSMNDTVTIASGVLNSSTSLVTNSVVYGPAGLNVAEEAKLDEVPVRLLLICAIWGLPGALIDSTMLPKALDAGLNGLTNDRLLVRWMSVSSALAAAPV